MPEQSSLCSGDVADRVGFEPTSRLRDYLISSQGRYDHFDTYPYLTFSGEDSVVILKIDGVVVALLAHLADTHATGDLHLLDILVNELLDFVRLAVIL